MENLFSLMSVTNVKKNNQQVNDGEEDIEYFN